MQILHLLFISVFSVALTGEARGCLCSSACCGPDAFRQPADQRRMEPGCCGRVFPSRRGRGDNRAPPQAGS